MEFNCCIHGVALGVNLPSDELFLGRLKQPCLLTPKWKRCLSPQLVALPRIWVKLIRSIVSVGGFEFDEFWSSLLNAVLSWLAGSATGDYMLLLDPQKQCDDVLQLQVSRWCIVLIWQQVSMLIATVVILLWFCFQFWGFGRDGHVLRRKDYMKKLE